MQIYRIGFLTLFWLNIGVQSYAQDSTSLPAIESKTPAFDPKAGESYPRNILFPPLLSFMLPGFDQYFEGQYAYGLGYSATAFAGMQLSKFKPSADVNDELGPDKKQDGLDFSYSSLGSSVYMLSGGLSAYHSFKTAVRTRPADFSFIEVEEDIGDLAKAPFEFSFLTRPTTYIPLALISGVLAAAIGADDSKSDLPSRSWHEGLITSFGYSYSAGVWEEAVFRGWMLPSMRYAFGSPTLAIITQGTIFGLAHYSPQNRVPLVQTISGIYHGWVSHRNGYSIREGIFEHFWWDAIIFGGLTIYSKTHGKKMDIYLPSIMIPL